MSSQPRAPTKQIRSHIVDPRRPITGRASGACDRRSPQPLVGPV